MRIIKLNVLVIAFYLFSNANGQVQDSITLFRCYRLVRQNAPQYGQLKLNSQNVDIEQAKVSSTNLPQVSVFGKAWYQSDAVSVSIPAIGLEGLGVDNFQYNAGVNIDQKVYDGGMVAIQKELSAIEGKIKDLETETHLYKLYELVNAYFFGIAMTQKNMEALGLKLELLKTREKSVRSGVRNGVVLQSELERLESEILNTERQ